MAPEGDHADNGFGMSAYALLVKGLSGIAQSSARVGTRVDGAAHKFVEQRGGEELAFALIGCIRRLRHEFGQIVYESIGVAGQELQPAAQIRGHRTASRDLLDLLKGLSRLGKLAELQQAAR